MPKSLNINLSQIQNPPSASFRSLPSFRSWDGWYKSASNKERPKGTKTIKPISSQNGSKQGSAVCNTDYPAAYSKISSALIQSRPCPQPPQLWVSWPPSGIQISPIGPLKVLTSRTLSSARLLQQPLRKSLPPLRNTKCISSGPPA